MSVLSSVTPENVLDLLLKLVAAFVNPKQGFP